MPLGDDIKTPVVNARISKFKMMGMTPGIDKYFVSINFKNLKLCVSIYLTRPWLKEGLSCSAEPQDPEPLRSSIAVKKVGKKSI